MSEESGFKSMIMFLAGSYLVCSSILLLALKQHSRSYLVRKEQGRYTPSKHSDADYIHMCGPGNLAMVVLTLLDVRTLKFSGKTLFLSYQGRRGSQGGAGTQTACKTQQAMGCKGPFRWHFNAKTLEMAKKSISEKSSQASLAEAEAHLVCYKVAFFAISRVLYLTAPIHPGIFFYFYFLMGGKGREVVCS